MTGFERRQEVVSALTHGLGLVASVIGGGILLTLAAGSADAWRIASTAVFATTMVLLYAASTLYHAARSGHLRARLRMLDHCAIYLLIAGSYTPFALVGLRGGWGWSLFGVAWGLAVVGVVFKLFFIGRFHFLSTATYVAMGWMSLLAIGPMLRHLDPSTLMWLLAGGVIYTAGTWFYHRDAIPYNHGIWHLFVIGGSICHAVAVATLL
ncbi:MAG: hemolysin III family protein [Gemmatimonadales bacterium]|nr:MAG: hemolysin III family protein [Gemmatimonadales bacterium]